MVTPSDGDSAVGLALSKVDIRNIKSVEDAMAIFGSAVTEASDTLGDGCELIKEKDQLIGKPFLILEARPISGDFGDFYTVAAILQDGRKVRFSDGSTGVAAQLAEIAPRGKDGEPGVVTGLMCRHGLNRSDYEVEIAGKPVEASTYYIDTSA
jgi:hypothetical protein